MLDTLTKPSTPLKALKLVPEGAVIKNSPYPLIDSFILKTRSITFLTEAKSNF